MFLELLIYLFIKITIIQDGVYGTLLEDCDSYVYCANAFVVRYPFWKKDDAAKRGYHCGYPGMSLSCIEGRAIINISNHLYYVQSFDYENKVFRIVDVDIDGSNCPQPRHNISFQSTALREMAPRTILYYNCTNYPPQNRMRHYQYVPCLDHVDRNVTLRSFVLKSDYYFDEAPIKGDWHEKCEETVEMPFLYHSNESNYANVFKFGFFVGWERLDSLPCENSGGKSLFNETTRKYNCFCREDYVVHESVCPQKDLKRESPVNPDLKRASPVNPDLKRESPVNVSNGRSIRMKIIIGLCTGVGASLLFLFLLISYRRNLFQTCCSVKNQSNVEVFLENCGTLVTQRYKYSDIKKMTASFKEILGQGGFGSVFKGKLSDGKLVAVKVLNDSENGQDFINEVATISRTNHVNVVNLLGYCSEGTKRALVYEFMPNGSLEKFIYNAKSSSNPSLHLGWENLYQIALGIAKGLEYLHRGCNTRILHFDIKPHNILLDEDFCPKISDFGLAKLCPAKESIVSLLGHRGTRGYAAPEIECRILGGISHKADIYSYGMMVLEMIGGRKNLEISVENMSEIYYPEWIYKHFKPDVNVDGSKEVFEDKNARKMITLALWCIQTQPALRPSITKVVEVLEGDTEEMQMPPNPFQDPPSSSSP